MCVSVRGGGTFLKLTITSTSSTFLTQQLARRLLNLPVSLSVATWLYFPVQAAAKSGLSGLARLKRKDKIHPGGQAGTLDGKGGQFLHFLVKKNQSREVGQLF